MTIPDDTLIIILCKENRCAINSTIDTACVV